MDANQRRRRDGLTYLDVIFVLLLIPLLLALILPSLNRARQMGSHVRCPDNLRQLGMALRLYANDNNGQFPRTYYLPDAPLTDTVADDTAGLGAFAGTNPFANDNPVGTNNITAAFFLLLRTEEIGAEVFICPSTNKYRDDFGGAGNTALNRLNWTNKRNHIAYSFANPYPDTRAFEAQPSYKVHMSLGSGFAIAADLNPGLKGPVAQPRFAGNSLNHNRQGQFVLYADGHAAWVQSPLCGLKADNIYTNAKGEFHASPVDGNDSVLLPTAE